MTGLLFESWNSFVCWMNSLDLKKYSPASIIVSMSQVHTLISYTNTENCNQKGYQYKPILCGTEL